MIMQPNIKQAEQARTIRNFLDKVVINVGVGRASQQASFEDKMLPQIVRDIGLIAGQKPQVRRAKKSIAGFKVRENQIIGLRVTLRGRSAVDFFERLTTIVLPRVRDFSGVDTTNVDAHGALNVGFREQLVFPEVNPEESTLLFSLGVNIVPKLRNRAVALTRYAELGIPFMKANNAKRYGREPSRKKARKTKQE